MATMQDHIDTLNGLLRGELAAKETYHQAIAKAGDAPGGHELHRIAEDHREAVVMLGKHITALSGKPDQTSGTWGTFAKAVEGAAKLFGNTAALKALKEGEEKGISDYKDALTKNLPSDCQALISSQLLPRTQAHIPVLDRLMSMQ